MSRGFWALNTQAPVDAASLVDTLNLEMAEYLEIQYPESKQRAGANYELMKRKTAPDAWAAYEAREYPAAVQRGAEFEKTSGQMKSAIAAVALIVPGLSGLYHCTLRGHYRPGHAPVIIPTPDPKYVPDVTGERGRPQEPPTVGFTGYTIPENLQIGLDKIQPLVPQGS